MSNTQQTIILIDDNLVIRENISELLTLEGYKVLEAENGRKGIDLAIQHKADLILCDVMMPDINGFEVFSALKEHLSYNNIPFIFLSAQAEIQDKCKSFDLGAEDYITKPFEETELISIIKCRILKSKSVKDTINSEKLIYLKELEDMATMLSHGVRSPLCSCLGLTQLFDGKDITSISEQDLIKIISGIKASVIKLGDLTALLSEQIYQSEIKHKNI